MMRVSSFLIIACLLTASCAKKEATTETVAPDTTTAAASTAPITKLTVQQKAPYGEVLADGSGRSLYIFMKDQNGAGTSECNDKCAEQWPPLTTASEAEPTEGAQATLVDTMTRRDGTRQVTYAGWPLYYSEKDQAAGDTHGEAVKDFGAEWHLISPEGEKVESSGQTKTR